MAHSHCSECNSKVDMGWEFCPKCGNGLITEAGRDLFSEIFERFGQEFAEMNKMFERQIEAVDISPMFRKSKGRQGGGFTINIVTSGNRPPEVQIRTFGDVDEKRLKRQVSQMVGSETEYAEQKAERAHESERIRVPDVTEEPKTDVKKVLGKVVVDMELPDVKEKDIDIKDLESSVEVKAVSGKKAFFKILKKPEAHKISNKKFEKGILHLEFS